MVIWKIQVGNQVLQKRHVNLIIPGSYFLKWATIPAMCHQGCVSAQSGDLESCCLPRREVLTEAPSGRTAVKLLIINKLDTELSASNCLVGCGGDTGQSTDREKWFKILFHLKRPPPLPVTSDMEMGCETNAVPSRVGDRVSSRTKTMAQRCNNTAEQVSAGKSVNTHTDLARRMAFSKSIK